MMTSHTLCKAQQTFTILSKSTGPPLLLLVYSVGKGVVTLRILSLLQ